MYLSGELIQDSAADLKIAMAAPVKLDVLVDDIQGRPCIIHQQFSDNRTHMRSAI